MTTKKQLAASRKNRRKARTTIRSAPPRQQERSRDAGRQRQEPGAGGSGAYYHIAVRPKNGFAAFRLHDVGRTGRLQRLAGRRRSGAWDTVQWLISKEDAHVEAGKLVADSTDAQTLLATLGSKPVQVKGDLFKAKARPRIPELENHKARQAAPSRRQ